MSFAAEAQTIRIADNNPGAPTGARIYGSVQAAINASSTGDIIYIQPSATNYGDFTVSKQVTVMGTGFNTGQGANSRVGTVTVSASNVTLKGFYVAAMVITSSLSLNNLVFENLYSSGSTITGNPIAAMSNVTFRNCYLTGVSFGGSVSTFNFINNVFAKALIISSASASNVLIANNLFFAEQYSPSVNDGYCISVSVGSSATNTMVVNNLFSGTHNVYNPIGFFHLVGSAVNNNIFYGVWTGIHPFGLAGNSSFGQFQGNSFNNNLAMEVNGEHAMPPYGTYGVNTGANNISNQDPMFVSASMSSVWTEGRDYTLDPGSPCINAGSDGTNIGPTGGPYPINQTIKFLPSHLPLITNMSTSGVLKASQQLRVNVNAKSN